jgi:tetratricopeptide (TPR) repeat protein
MRKRQKKQQTKQNNLNPNNNNKTLSRSLSLASCSLLIAGKHLRHHDKILKEGEVKIMSGQDGEVADVCASCGIAEIDEMKLKECAACKSVLYCSDECERDHRQQHEGACEKRAAELRDEILFKEPESNYLGDCPICFLPLPFDLKKSTLMSCCSKTICNGCCYVHVLRHPLKQTCPFCRHPVPESQAEVELNMMKRVEKNDPVAMTQMGTIRYNEGDYSSAFEYWTKAAELGDANARAHAKLATLYHRGEGVEKDEKKALYHWEETAICGDPLARHVLAVIEMNNGRPERAVKHFIIAANVGYDVSMKELWKCYAKEYISKDDLTVTLRTHQAAINATKSPQREAAEEAKRRGVF